MKNMDLPESAIFEISNDWRNSDDSVSIVFNINSVFREWFKSIHGLRRWSDKRLQKVISDSFEGSGIKKKTEISIVWIDREQ